ncbi:MAG TPA: HAD family phosphatase [Pseudonocardiaceae bacterium]
MTSGGLGELLARTRHVLLDFDGPICSVFAGITSTAVASRLSKVLTGAGITPPAEITGTDDPFDILRYTLAHAPELTTTVETAFRAEEVAAATTAAPTPGAAQTIQACHDTGRTVAIVSNNSDDAVRTYLTTHNLSGHINYISARTPADITRLKPHPHLVIQAAQALDAAPPTCVLIGDSITDVQAAQAAGVPAIGYANKASKPTRFTGAGTAGVITRMIDLATALRSV